MTNQPHMTSDPQEKLREEYIANYDTEKLVSMNDLGYWFSHIDEEGKEEGGMSMSKEMLDKYVAAAVRQELESHCCCKFVNGECVEPCKYHGDQLEAERNRFLDEVEKGLCQYEDLNAPSKTYGPDDQSLGDNPSPDLSLMYVSRRATRNLFRSNLKKAIARLRGEG